MSNVVDIELVEVLDELGRVVDVVPRARMRAENLRHRSVGIVVCHGSRVLVHQRAGWKDVWPSRWDLAFGGVCDVGERFPDAARRELAEEAGIEVAEEELLDLGDGRYEDDAVRVVARLYAVAHEGPFRFADGEVQSIEWLERNELAAFAASHELCDDSRELLLPRLAP
jgi:8-oxo-dGTP pyrophosphatase MutT (NUDIX family)